MANKLEWPQPESTDVTSIRIRRASSKAGALSIVTTTDAKDSTGDWVLEYTDTDGAATDWYTIEFYDSVLLAWMGQSDRFSPTPTGKPYAKLRADERYLKRVFEGYSPSTRAKVDVLPDELERAEQTAESIIEGYLGLVWSATIPDLIFLIADLLGSAEVTDYLMKSASPNASAYAQRLRDRAYALLKQIKDGLLVVPDETTTPVDAEALFDTAASGTDDGLYFTTDEDWEEMSYTSVPSEGGRDNKEEIPED